MLMGSKMLNEFQDDEVTRACIFKAAMNFMEKAKMVRINDLEDWEMNRLLLVDAEVLSRFGIIEKPIVPEEIKGRAGLREGRIRGRGRPARTKASHGVTRVTV